MFLKTGINSESVDDSFIKINKTIALIVFVVAGVVCTAVIAGCCICAYWNYVKYLQNKDANDKSSIQTVNIHSFKHMAIPSASFNDQDIVGNENSDIPDKQRTILSGIPETKADGDFDDVAAADDVFGIEMKRIIDGDDVIAAEIEGKRLSFSKDCEDMYDNSDENDGIPYGRTTTEITDLNTLDLQ